MRPKARPTSTTGGGRGRQVVSPRPRSRSRGRGRGSGSGKGGYPTPRGSVGKDGGGKGGKPIGGGGKGSKGGRGKGGKPDAKGGGKGGKPDAKGRGKLLATPKSKGKQKGEAVARQEPLWERLARDLASGATGDPHDLYKGACNHRLRGGWVRQGKVAPSRRAQL